MPIQVIESDRLYQKIARQLSELIAAGEFKPGEPLPAERELARQLAVSRPSVREALMALEIEGKVEIRVGSGVYVVERPAPVTAGEAEEGEGPFELIQARSAVEGETAALAAREATTADGAAIQAAVDDLARLGGAPEIDLADREFHLAVARASHNGPLLAVVELLWDRGRGAVWKQMEKHFQTPELLAATLRDHRAVSVAIQAQDAPAARKAMRAHLARVAHEFTRGWLSVKRRWRYASAQKVSP